jgi:uncharacterized RDD family membrane protein YckC
VLAAEAAAAAAAVPAHEPETRPRTEPRTESETEPVTAPEAAVAVPREESRPEPMQEPVQQELLRYSVSSDSIPAAPVTPAQARVSRSAHSFVETDLTDPFEDAIVEPAHPLPARLIENPRELVAPRKARPRLAEGPLREEQDDHAAGSAAESAPGEQPMAPIPTPESVRTAQGNRRAAPPRTSIPPRSQWLSIQLDTESAVRVEKPSRPQIDDLPLHVASFEDRLTAGLVDCGLVASAFLLFVAVFAFSTTHLPTGRVAFAGAGAILLAMILLYQFVFFTLTDATPGMRYSRIALCTFDDENPTQPAMRARIGALLLSALPLGLGFFWAIFDEDSLSWHDRITRTYQRSYREQ